MDKHEQVRATYLRFAEHEGKGYSAHYFVLANAVAADQWLVDFISQMPVIQPNLFFASIQLLTGPESMPTDGAELRRLVKDRSDDIQHLMTTRRTQTNEPGRCASLLPAMPRGPLAIVEVGASAGLCLWIDKYSYQYDNVRLGPDSSVNLECDVTGVITFRDGLPNIQWRAGLDIAPLDIHDDDDADWLLACVWPDHPIRRERLAAAINLARKQTSCVRIGDLASDLEALLADVPDELQLVVFHSAVLTYCSTEQKCNFENILEKVSRSRPITWVSNEGYGVVPSITKLAQPTPSTHFLLGRTTMSNDSRHDELLAISHCHGATLEWLDSMETVEPFEVAANC